MPHHTRRIVLTACCTLALTASAALAGPPWISVEYPANPHHPTTRDATFLVHAFHHGEHIAPTISATFEGLVDGRRQTLTARITRTHRAGVYAVRGDVPPAGTWLAVVRLRDGTAPATALVTLGDDAQVLAIDVPTDRSRDGWSIPRDVSEAEIVSALRAANGMRTAQQDEGSNAAYAGVALAMLALAGVGRAVRRG